MRNVGVQRPQKFARALLLVAAFALVAPGAVFGAPQWVDTFGTVSPYMPPVYLSGFGSAERNEDNTLELAKQRALSDLAMQLDARVQSTVSSMTQDNSRSASSSLTSRIRVESDIEIENADFRIEEQRGDYYALAYVRISDLQERETRQAAAVLDQLADQLDQARTYLQAGNLSDAQTAIGRAEARVADLQAAKVRWETLQHLRASGRSWELADSISSLSEAIGQLMASVETYEPQTLDAAIRHVINQLSAADVRIVGSEPLAYENTDFSSRFGARFSSLLATGDGTSASARRRSTTEEVVLSGSFWPEEEVIRISVIGRSPESGESVVVARTSLPMSAVAEDDLKPPNADQAFKEGLVLSGDAVADGGIRVEMWATTVEEFESQRGRDQDMLVFHRGEWVQVYFRVNQPAHLRLTYFLATGQKVLIEESFYIGRDKVNRLVPLPYPLEVVPPFGTERMVVTAYSQEPPQPNVVPIEVDGETYEGFADAEDVVARTRGLKKPESAEDERFGEAFLTMTMVNRID